MLSSCTSFGEKPCTIFRPADDIKSKIAPLFSMCRMASLCFPRLFNTHGPSRLNKLVLINSCCCRVIHVVTTLPETTICTIILVELVKNTCDVVLFSTLNRYYRVLFQPESTINCRRIYFLPQFQPDHHFFIPWSPSI
jgi:hypothetical protein